MHIQNLKKKKTKTKTKNRKFPDQLSTSSGETECPNSMLVVSPVTSVSLGYNNTFVLTGNALLSIYSHVTISLQG